MTSSPHSQSTQPFNQPVIFHATSIEVTTQVFEDVSLTQISEDATTQTPSNQKTTITLATVIIPPFADYVLIPARMLFDKIDGFVFRTTTQDFPAQGLHNWDKQQVLFVSEPITDTIKHVEQSRRSYLVTDTIDRSTIKKAGLPMVVPPPVAFEWTEGLSNSIIHRVNTMDGITEPVACIRLFGAG